MIVVYGVAIQQAIATGDLQEMKRIFYSMPYSARGVETNWRNPRALPYFN
jgi:Domain of unknown function (DUF1843)